ncbi:hypothetical protein M569_02114, partial [Genlisea aurea]
GSSNWWWIDSHGKESPSRSPWLMSTLAELEEKTKGMMKLIEEEADTFAQRAEMYYKKRPELITMVQEFYKTHRSLAEQFDHMRSESTPSRGLPTPWSSSSASSFANYRLEKSLSMIEKGCDIYSEESDGGSVVENPDEEEEEDVATRLGEMVERLREENRVQKRQLREKDEEKREVIRQLSLAMELLREENLNLRKDLLVRNSEKKVEIDKSRGLFIGRFLKGF